MTDREKFTIADVKEELYKKYDYRCAVCGGNLYQYGTPQLAHRIAQTKANISKYGKDIIQSKYNLLPVCSLKCNDMCNIGNKTKLADELAENIKSLERY